MSFVAEDSGYGIPHLAQLFGGNGTGGVAQYRVLACQRQDLAAEDLVAI